MRCPSNGLPVKLPQIIAATPYEWQLINPEIPALKDAVTLSREEGSDKNIPTGWKKPKLDHFLPRFESTHGTLNQTKKRLNTHHASPAHAETQRCNYRQQGSTFQQGLPTNSERERKDQFHLPSRRSMVVHLPSSMIRITPTSNVMFTFKQKLVPKRGESEQKMLTFADYILHLE